MSFDENPIGPLQRALRSVLRRLLDTRLLAPFLLLALVKATLLAGFARLDVLPAHLVAAVLWVLPEAIELLHYPQTLHNLPELSRWMDRIVFVTLGALLHGWAILYLTRIWTQVDRSFMPRLVPGLLRLCALSFLACLVLGIPFAVQFAAARVAPGVATPVALAAGFLVQLLLFTAPAFLLIERRSLAAAVRSSFQAVSEYPIALPLAVVVLALLHAPFLLLRMPLLISGRRHDPDWILYALLAQVVVDMVGAILAAGLAARFALSSTSRRRVV